MGSSAARSAFAVVGAVWVHVVLAQAPADAELPRVVVTGARASLAGAQQIKQDKLEIVDAVVADDIAKLPDFSVTEALQRVTGVQITRDRGEGGTVTIRGLTQMETLLNGREVFTAGTGRNFDFADIAAELVAGIDVYKTSSAAQLEGGLGGIIDLRTRRPFDFAGRQALASARLIHGDLAGSSEPQLSLLASQRWALAGAGEFGALVNLSVQRRAFREDQKGTGEPVALNDLVAGRTVRAPNGTSETTSVGERKRTAAHVALQWRPSPALELYGEASHAELRTDQESHQVGVVPCQRPACPAAAPAFVPGSVTLFPGTDDLRSITWTQVPMSILSFARDTVDRTRQAAVGGIWTRDALTLKADLSRTTSFNHLFFSGPFLAATAGEFTHDLSGGVPGTQVTGTDLLDPSALRYTGLAYRTRPFEGDLTAFRVDAQLRVEEGWIRRLSAGVRHARRGASNAPGLIFADAAVTGLTAADRPSFVMPNPYRFFPGVGSPSLHDFLVGNLATARDAAGLREAFGITAPIPAAANPLSLWTIEEQTDAAHAMVEFQAARLPVDGNVGLRMVRTREAVTGSQSLPASGGVGPIAIGSRYTDWLPSVNLRWRPAPGWVLRAAASKTLTRPNFDQLSPSLTLVPNPINPSLNQGGSGNPSLKPVRADNFDIAAERYFGPATSVVATVFVKKVDGFVTTVSSPEVHDGATYQVSRPQNSDAADIKGVELGYQQFYDGLPGWLRGFGVQANYTYIDSEAPNNALGIVLPLQNLSRHSVNLVGIYERGQVSARLAYNWRDKFLSGLANVVGIGALPIYTRGYGWLDASLRYQASERVSLALEGTNLTRTRRGAYYGVETRPQGHWLNDRQLSLSATIRF
ncbi:TonB-dependent receptor [Piscinibacter sp. XHJ-5]|uniref:TonB-dependent receptor n=1 Tax=Piscinibacter sp. XHJ-5 TaxID=3037797 RepID=UPI0024528662|nr:TonB-dependent receptor [Piscinibacter sp. XHJ-5]